MSILGVAGPVAAQTEVTGALVGGSGEEALPFANVGLMRTSDTVFVRGATTDMEGRFRISEVDSGDYLLRATSVGYIPIYKEISVPGASQPSRIDLGTMRMEQGTTLQEVRITAERPLYSMDGEKNMYNVSDDPSVQTGTAADALQNAPGVEVDAEGNITLRGVSSVEIWINDRPSHMQAEALKQYIKQLPAGAIERIEVITNPSARYSSSGGVINIVTSQKVTRNELLCFGVNAGSTPNVSPWLSYVFANEKIDFNIYVNGHYGRYTSSGSGGSTLINSDGDTARTQAYTSDGRGHNVGGYVGGNFNWNIDSVSSLAAWLGFYPGYNVNHNDARYTYIEHLPTPVDYGYDATFTQRSLYHGGYGGLWYQHQYDTTGRKLSLSLNGNYFGGRPDHDYRRDYHNASLRDIDRRQGGSQLTPSVSVSADYELPLGHDWEMELGLEGDYSGDVSSNTIDTLDPASGRYLPDHWRTYDGRFSTTGAGAYATAQKRWGNFTAKVGLRATGRWLRGTYNDIDSVRVDKGYLEMTPSLHLSYRTANFHNFSLSYTHRTASPSAEQLCRFRCYGDEGFDMGNPALGQSHTHNLEAAWSKFFMKFGSVGVNAYFRANTDQVQGITDVMFEDVYFHRWVNYTTDVNVGSSHTEGVEANVTIRPTAMMNLRLTASLFNNSFTYDGAEQHKLSYSLRANAWAKLWGWLQVFANLHYNSPSLSLYSISRDYKSFDLGVSTDLLDNRLSVYVNVNDLFDWAGWGSTGTNPSYQSTSTSRYSMRSVNVGLTWRIGKLELQSKAREGGDTSTAPAM